MRKEVKLLRLIASSSEDGLLVSKFSGSAGRNLLSRYVELGAMKLGREGHGQRATVSNRELLNKLIRSDYPEGLDFSFDLSQKEAISKTRDAHNTSKSGYSIHLKSSSLNVTCQLGDSHEIHLDKIVASGGAYSICVDDNFVEHFNLFIEGKASGRLCLVENPNVFWNMTTALDVDLFILTGSNGGRMSHRLMKWLSSSTMKNFSILQFGDFDPVGISEYLKMRDFLRFQSLDLFWDDRIPHFLKKYGSPQRILDQQNILHEIKNHPNIDSCTKRAIKLFDELGKGLDQEIWIDNLPPN